MPNTTSQAIVDETLALRQSHPHAPALDVLDLVMQRHSRTSPDFDAVRQPDCLDLPCPFLPCPFAEVLRQAFAPKLNAVDMTGATPADRARHKAFIDRWLVVIDRFARRYGLWEPR